METRENSTHIGLMGEFMSTERLIEKIRGDWWVDEDTIIVNCFPPYSSLLSQVMSHMLSLRNHNEPIDIVNLNMPYPNMSQVLDVTNPLEYVLFDSYLRDWMRTYVRKGYKYLFTALFSGDGRDLHKIYLAMKSRLHEDFRFAALFLQDTCSFEVDYYQEECKQKPIFSWENTKNPNFKYE